MLTHFQAELVKKIQLTKDIFEFRFKPSTPIPFNAGEYMVLKVGDKRRLYSISSGEDETEYFELLVQIIPNGVGSGFLASLPLGGSADFMGPAGQFIARKNRRDKIFLATGTGIAPIKSQILALTKLDYTIVLFWGMRTRNDLYYFDFFDTLARENPMFKFYICLTREEDATVFDSPNFKNGRVQNVLERFLEVEDKNFPNEYDYNVCGGREMVSEVTAYLNTKGVLREHVFFEKF